MGQMTMAELERLREMGMADCITLEDAEKIQIDDSLPPTERMLDYLEKIKNPYCFLCGETPVRVVFAENGAELGAKLRTYFLSLKR